MSRLALRNRLRVPAGDAALAVRREVVFEVRVGIGAQHLHGVRPARRRIRRLVGQRVGLEVGAAQLVREPRDRREHVQRRGIVPAFPERGVQRADDRTLQPQLDVVPRRVLAVLLGTSAAPARSPRWFSSSRREWHRSMPPANATSRSGARGCRITTSFWWCDPPNRTRWSSSTSPPARSIASPRCRFSSSL